MMTFSGGSSFLHPIFYFTSRVVSGFGRELVIGGCQWISKPRGVIWMRLRRRRRIDLSIADKSHANAAAASIVRHYLDYAFRCQYSG